MVSSYKNSGRSSSDERWQLSTPVKFGATQAHNEAQARGVLYRISSSWGRVFRGPYAIGERVLVYRKGLRNRRVTGRKSTTHSGGWYGPGIILCTESAGQRLRPRIYYVSMHGRL